MRKHELTINGLTKSAARQLGQAYFAVAESMDMIDDLSASNATASRTLCDLSMEAARLLSANAGLKKRIRQLETGEAQDAPDDKTDDAADAARYALEMISERDPFLARIDIRIPAQHSDSYDTPLPELDGLSRNEVRRAGKEAAKRIADAFGDVPDVPKHTSEESPVV